MGYRSRLGKVVKAEKVRFEGKSAKEVEAMLPEDSSCYYPDFHTELYGLGKYFDFTKGEAPFYSFDIEEECEAEFYIMSKEELKSLIGDYHSTIKSYLESLKSGKAYLESKQQEWDSRFDLKPYYLDEEHPDGFITPSWKYEYAIFNLVHIYRSFDWENDYLIYSAW
jgi:hypothetical protein